MRDFNLIRQKQPDGSVDHVLYFFLLGPDGKEVAMYDPFRSSPEAIAAAIKRTIAQCSSRAGRQPATSP